MSGADDGPVGRREVAYRLFASEYDGADLEYSDSDEERAPNYVVTPTGARVNRLFVVGVLTEVEPVSDDVLRARVVDPTGAFVAYAGQYQPEAVAFLEDAEVPSFVSLTGKARTFQPDGSDRVFTSVRPESLTAVDAATRDRWTVQAAEHTLARVATMARALEREERGEALATALREAGVSPGLASGVSLAIDHYGTTPGYLSAIREQALAAAELVAGDRDEVPDLELAPGDDGPASGDLTAAPAVTGTLAADAELAAPEAPAQAPATEAPDQPEEESPEPEEAEPEPEETATEPEEADPEPEEPAAEPVEPPSPELTEPAEEDAPDPEPAEPATEEAPESAETDGTAPAEVEASDDEPGEALGDFDAGGEDVGQYDLDEAEREEVEAEFGTEFSTGSEVGEPGEAGIEPEVEPPDAAEAESTETDEPEDDGSPGEVDEPEAAEDSPDEEPEDVDLEDAAVEAMADLDDGDGADRDAVVERVAEAHGADPDDVESAIDEALMGGRCYEPSDGTLKAI